jgi:integrase
MPERVHVWVQQFRDRPHLALQWVDPVSGKRRTRTAATANQRVAEQRAADLAYELSHGLHRDPSALTWEAFRDIFEDEYLAGAGEATAKSYRTVFNTIQRVVDPQLLRSVDERTLSAFAAAQKRSLNPVTVRSRLALLHKALCWAVEQKFIPAVPKFPHVKVSQKLPEPVPPESFERLLAKAPDAHWRAFLLCGWLGGLRLMEAFRLERQETTTAPWVDFSRNRIVFPAEFVKARRDQWVPLDPVLRDALEAVPRFAGPQCFRLTGQTGVKVSPSWVSEKIKTMAAAAGVKLTYRSLRRGYGSYYAARVPAQVLQKLMRHANIGMTMRYYANIDTAVEEAVRQRHVTIPAYLSPDNT